MCQGSSFSGVGGLLLTGVPSGVEVTLGPLLGGGRRSTLDGRQDLPTRLSESVDEMSSRAESPLLPPVMTEGGREDALGWS